MPIINFQLYKHLHIWRLRHISESTFITILSIVVGLLSGLAAVALKTAVHKISSFLLSIGYQLPIVNHQLSIILYPIVGIALTVVFVRYILRKPIGHGIPNVLLAISRHKGKLPSRNMYGSLIASSLTVGFGGSVGLEAPIASTGSAIGSNIGRLCRLQPKHIKMLLGCGAAGAIAGIFKAPLAGILFVVEVYLFDLTKTSAIPLLLSSISATTVAYFLMGSDVEFAFSVIEDFQLSQIPFYIVLGICCALSSIYFLRVTDKVEGLFSRIHSPWLKMLIGGVLLSLLILVFPPLFGEGYGTLTALLNGKEPHLLADFIVPTLSAQLLPFILLILILLKTVATAVTIGSGGVGGTFGPSLIIGGLTGYMVACLSNLLGLPPQSTANFALVGMAAVMAGVMHAPLMATFLIAEITGGYALMAPLLISVAVTYLCVNPFEKHSIYARKLALHGDLLTHDKDQSAWQLLDMHKLIETNFISLRKGDNVHQLLHAIEDSHRNIFPVLTSDDKFLGVIHLDDVRKIIFKPQYYDTFHVEDLMSKLTEGDIVHLEDSLSDVVDKFRLGPDKYNLVVLDKDENYLGFLSRANTFSAYRRFISASSEE